MKIPVYYKNKQKGYIDTKRQAYIWRGKIVSIKVKKMIHEKKKGVIYDIIKPIKKSEPNYLGWLADTLMNEYGLIADRIMLNKYLKEKK